MSTYQQNLEDQLHKYIERKNKLLSEVNTMDIVITLTKDKIKKAGKEPNADESIYIHYPGSILTIKTE